MLVCQRPPHKRHGGLWEFPGGKAEVGESDADAVSRELAEELGVAVTFVDSPRFEYADPESPFMIAFCDVEITGEPTCREHMASGWFTLDEASDLPLAPSDAQFVRWLKSQRSPRPSTSDARRNLR